VRSPLSDAELEQLEAVYNTDPIDFSILSDQALELLRYVFGQGQRHAVEGWFSVSKLRDNWGRNRQLNADAIKALLREINALGAGEFRADEEREWRPTLSPDFLPSFTD
jgi:hypothetical protein